MLRKPSLLVAFVLACAAPLAAQAARDAATLSAALLGDTPMLADLGALTNGIGGRATGSPANLASVDWAMERFREAGVTARREAFTMPALWLERASSATVRGGRLEFSPRVAAMPWSPATPAGGITAALVDGGRGTAEDLARLGTAARGAWVLVRTAELEDIEGLFREYAEAVGIEARVSASGAAGMVWQSSRPGNSLARHNASLGPANRLPILMMERDGAARALRLLEAGQRLTLAARSDIPSGGSDESWNVIGEIPGTSRANEIVIVGAHLDSWDLGDGALDNGCNVAMLIDIARQIRRLGLRPERTIRFALWNGEEQMMIGSWGYVQSHAAELDRHVMAGSFDIGSGRITGFFTGGRPEVAAAVTRALAPVAGLGPFEQVDAPIVGTDNYDFMMQGVPNIVANQASANYGPNYHARSDTYERVDAGQLRLNAAIAATVIWAFANGESPVRRVGAREVGALVSDTDLGDQMRAMGTWADWEAGRRGLKP